MKLEIGFPEQSDGKMMKRISFVFAISIAATCFADDKEIFSPYSGTPAGDQTPIVEEQAKKDQPDSPHQAAVLDPNDLFAKPPAKDLAKKNEKDTKGGGKGSSIKDSSDDAMMAVKHPDDAPQVKGIMVLVSNDDLPKTEAIIHKYARLVISRNIPPAGVKIMVSKPIEPSLMERVTNALNEEVSSSGPPAANAEEVGKLTPAEIQNKIAAFTKGNSFVHSIMLSMLVETSLTIPEEIPVTKLPSWVLRTDKGDIVMEGLSDPQRYITKDGYFVEPAI